MDRASDSGSEGWGFESLPVYQIKEEIPNGYLLFYFALRAGLEEAGPAEGWAKKCPGDTFLGRGRVHSRQTHSVGMSTACYLLPVYHIRTVTLIE